MPDGKPAGERCVHLTADNLCELFGRRARPRVCSEFPPAADACGGSREEALVLLAQMEEETTPGAAGD